MKEAEIQAEINVMERHLAARETEVRHIEEQIAVARTQLAEAEKPKLRHGDYGYRQGHDEAVIIMDSVNRNEAICFRTKDGSVGEYTSVKHENCIILGNIFDDLTALSGDLTEFNVMDIKFSIDLDDMECPFKIKADGSSWWINEDDIKKLIRNLQIMYATMKRQKGEEKPND